MPLASVSLSHMLASSGFLETLRQRTIAGGVSGGYVGGELAVEHGVADAALQAASPDGGIVVGAALVVGLETRRRFCRGGRDWGRRARCRRELAKKKLSGFFSLARRRSLSTELEDAIGEGAPVGGRAGGRQLAADGAVALGQAAERRPAVGVEAVDVVERVDLADDGGDVVVHVGGEHAGLEEARFFAAELHGAVFVAHGPLGMGFERVAPVEVGAHAGDDAHAALFGGGDAFTEKVAVVEELSVAVERDFGGIEGEDAGDADEDDVGTRRSASSRPTPRCS